MHDQRPELRGFFAKNTKCDGVDRNSAFLIALGPVDGSVGGRVDDDIRTNPGNKVANSFRIGKIAVGKIYGYDIAQRREATLQLETDLTILTGEQDSHQLAPYCLPIQFL